jgi:hypothetical protein
MEPVLPFTSETARSPVARTAQTNLRSSDAERELWLEVASLEGKSFGEWAREVLNAAAGQRFAAMRAMERRLSAAGVNSSVR